MMNLFIVKYTGPFGFIKPWTAVRDSETFSQQFLTPSIVEGIEKKLFPELLELETGQIHKIVRHRLSYRSIEMQQEKTWAKGGIVVYKDKGQYKTNVGILNRGIMIEPELTLAFTSLQDATAAMTQTVCLCRNEDLLFPVERSEVSEEQLDNIDGFELLFTDKSQGFKVGHNRFADAGEMHGQLKVFGNPTRA